MKTNQKQSFDYEELLECARGEMFGPANARLPLPNMLMVDRITHISSEGGAHGRGLVTAELDIHPELWFFDCHFPTDPVMPGCLGLDGMWQLLGFYLGWLGNQGKGRALGVKEVRFRGQVLPTHKIVTYQLDIERVRSSKLVLGVADGTLAVDGTVIYSTKGLRVGLFISTEDF